MGNCLLGGMGDRDQSMIRVATSTGGVMEFNAPITVESITDEFPGHGLFRRQDLFWKPLPHSQVLLAGESYHLLPLMDVASKAAARARHVRSNSEAPPQITAPYRVSFDSRGVAKSDGRPYGGFWKVKLVISPEQLLEVLSEEGKTEELIESVRTVAKCGSVSSDEWGMSLSLSLSSSRNAASSTSLLEF